MKYYCDFQVGCQLSGSFAPGRKRLKFPAQSESETSRRLNDRCWICVHLREPSPKIGPHKQSTQFCYMSKTPSIGNFNFFSLEIAILPRLHVNDCRLRLVLAWRVYVTSLIVRCPIIGPEAGVFLELDLLTIINRSRKSRCHISS